MPGSRCSSGLPRRYRSGLLPAPERQIPKRAIAADRRPGQVNSELKSQERGFALRYTYRPRTEQEMAGGTGNGPKPVNGKRTGIILIAVVLAVVILAAFVSL